MATVRELVLAHLRERGIDPGEVKIRERVHIEKVDKSGPEPVLVESVTIEGGQREE